MEFPLGINDDFFPTQSENLANPPPFSLPFSCGEEDGELCGRGRKRKEEEEEERGTFRSVSAAGGGGGKVEGAGGDILIFLTCPSLYP